MKKEDCMKVWTMQPKSVLDEIEITGTYRCDRSLSFNLSKPDSLDSKYQWLITRMEDRIGKRPEGVEYPIWAWHTWDGKRQCPNVESPAFLKRNEDKVLLTLEIPEKDVVLTDFEAWQIVLDGGYLTKEIDEEKLEELEAYIDSLDEDTLEKEIEKSWENVLEYPNFGANSFVQATFWEIKKEYVIDTKIVLK